MSTASFKYGSTGAKSLWQDESRKLKFDWLHQETRPDGGTKFCCSMAKDCNKWPIRKWPPRLRVEKTQQFHAAILRRRHCTWSTKCVWMRWLNTTLRRWIVILAHKKWRKMPGRLPSLPRWWLVVGPCRWPRWSKKQMTILLQVHLDNATKEEIN